MWTRFDSVPLIHRRSFTLFVRPTVLHKESSMISFLVFNRKHGWDRFSPIPPSLICHGNARTVSGTQISVLNPVRVKSRIQFQILACPHCTTREVRLRISRPSLVEDQQTCGQPWHGTRQHTDPQKCSFWKFTRRPNPDQLLSYNSLGASTDPCMNQSPPK